MTEQEWLTSNDPEGMIQHLVGGASPRKLRLFACAIMVMNQGITRGCLAAVERAEVFADGEGRLDPLHVGYRYIAELPDPVNAARLAVVHYLDQPEKKVEIIRCIFGNPFRLPDPRIRWCPPWLFWNDGIIPRLAQRIYYDRNFSDMAILADALEEAGCGNENMLMHCRGWIVCRKCNGVGVHPAFEFNPPLVKPVTVQEKCPDCNGVGWEESVFSHVRGCWVIDLLLGKI